MLPYQARENVMICLVKYLFISSLLVINVVPYRPFLSIRVFPLDIIPRRDVYARDCSELVTLLTLNES